MPGAASAPRNAADPPRLSSSFFKHHGSNTQEVTNHDHTTAGCSRRRQHRPQRSGGIEQLYFWVLIAIVIGVLVGWLAPTAGQAMEPIGTTFVTAMKMLIGPIVFLTIVGGIASVADLKKVGLTGIKALTYFQVGTILAMIAGLVAINIFRLGDGVNADPGKIETSESAQKLISTGETQHWWEFVTHIVPDSVSVPSSRATSSRSSSWQSFSVSPSTPLVRSVARCWTPSTGSPRSSSRCCPTS